MNFNGNQKDYERRKMMEMVVKRLQEMGMPVMGAGFINLGDSAGINPKQKAPDLNSAKLPSFENLLNQKQEEFKKEKCFCPNCFNFDTFEETLKDEPGAKFDYTEVTLGNKVYCIKYCISDNRKEDFMISSKDEVLKAQSAKKENVKDSSADEAVIKETLAKAVSNKDFVTAQVCLDALNKMRQTN